MMFLWITDMDGVEQIINPRCVQRVYRAPDGLTVVLFADGDRLLADGAVFDQMRATLTEPSV